MAGSTIAIMRKQNTERKHYSAIAGLAITLAFFFHQYQSLIPGITIGELMLIISTGMIIATNCRSVRIKRTYLLLLFYAFSLVFSLLSVLLFREYKQIEGTMVVMSRWIRYGIYVLFITAYCDNFSGYATAVTLYRSICFAVSIYTIAQFIVFMILGFYLPNNPLPFLPRPRNMTSEKLLYVSRQYYFRAYSVFDEPAYLTEFLLPGFVLALSELGKKDKRDIWLLIVISVSIVLSTSVQGYVMAFGAFCLYLLMTRNRFRGRDIKKRIALIAAMVIALVIVFSSSLSSVSIQRIMRIGKELQGDYSSKLRLFRGFAYWWELDPIHKLFGVGMGNSANYAFANNVATAYDYYFNNASTLGFMNGIARILVEHGLILFVVFCVFLVSLYRNHNGIGSRVLLLMYTLMLLSGSGVFTVETVLYLFLIIAYSQPMQRRPTGYAEQS